MNPDYPTEPTGDAEPLLWYQVRAVPCAEPADPDELASAASTAPAWTTCWRCGKVVPDSELFCGYCRAPLAANVPGPCTIEQQASADTQPLMAVLWIFAALLLTSILYGMLIRFGFSDQAVRGPDAYKQQLYHMLTIEAVDTFLVLLAIVWAGRPPRLPAPEASRRLTAWVSAPFVLAGLLAVNYAYHLVIRKIIDVPLFFDQDVIASQLTGLSLLAVCVQPAIVEELFFRYLALGTLRRVTGTHLAVILSSVMFGIAHLGVPLSMPLLMLIGLALGYLRVCSGSLLLPIGVHFLHNAAILWIETLP